jgi:hypothetical protein
VGKDNGAVDKGQFGKLILHSIPTKEAEEMVVSYLARMAKKVPPEKMARKVRKTPSVLSRNIAAASGQKIAHHLRDLGARAEFVPHDQETQVLEGLSEAVSASDIESIEVMSERYDAPRPKGPKSSRAGKKLMTAIVVVILMAVFSLLTWQLYHLLTTKVFH